MPTFISGRRFGFIKQLYIDSHFKQESNKGEGGCDERER
jgi:hypothetical protein